MENIRTYRNDEGLIFTDNGKLLAKGIFTDLSKPFEKNVITMKPVILSKKENTKPIKISSLPVNGTGRIGRLAFRTMLGII